MKIKVYQLNPEKDSRHLLFMSHDFAVEHGGIKSEEYKCVFDGNVEAESLEGIYTALNEKHPVGYNGHSLSVSDIVELEDGSCNFCDSVGFVRLANFDSSLVEPISGHRMVVVEPGKPAYEMVIPDGLEPLQQAVGGYIEVTYPLDGNAFIISNECAKLEHLEGNRRIEGEIYAGVILIAADDGHGGTTDLTDEQVAKYSKMFATPEVISDEEVARSLWFEFYTFS